VDISSSLMSKSIIRFRSLAARRLLCVATNHGWTRS